MCINKRYQASTFIYNLIIIKLEGNQWKWWSFYSYNTVSPTTKNAGSWKFSGKTKAKLLRVGAHSNNVPYWFGETLQAVI